MYVGEFLQILLIDLRDTPRATHHPRAAHAVRASPGNSQDIHRYDAPLHALTHPDIPTTYPLRYPWIYLGN